MPKEYAPRRLPLTREYPGYQFYALLEYANLPAESCFCYAALCITDWLKKRVHDPAYIPEEARRLPSRDAFQNISPTDLTSFQINLGFTANTVCLPAHGLWTLRLKEPDSKTDNRDPIPGRFFTTNVGLHLLDDRRVELAIRIDVLDPEGAPEVDHAFRPAFVRTLFATDQLIISQLSPLLYEKARPVTTEQDWKDLRKILDSSSATLPVILFTEEIRLPDPADLGLAAPMGSFPDPAKPGRAAPVGSSAKPGRAAPMGSLPNPADPGLAAPVGPLRQMPSIPLFPKTPTLPAPVSAWPIDPDDFASHAFGFAITVSVTENLHDAVAKKIRKSYDPGDVIFMEPRRFGGRIRIYDGHGRDAYERIKLDSRIFSKNKSYSFGDAKFDYDVRNLEHRELIRSIQESRDLKAEEKLAELNRIIEDLQNENESRVRKIDELKAQNKAEFQQGEAAERQRSARLAEENEEKTAQLHQVQARIALLERENRDARSYRDAAEAFRAMDSMPETAEDVAQYFQTVFGDRLVFTDRGLKTAARCKIKPAGLWFYLYYMATELYDLHHTHVPDVEAEFKAATTIEVAMGEGKQSRKDNSTMSSRIDSYEGKEIWAEPHVKLVPARAGQDFQRIYYCYDLELDRIIISHVGDHLKNYGTRSAN